MSKLASTVPGYHRLHSHDTKKPGVCHTQVCPPTSLLQLLPSSFPPSLLLPDSDIPALASRRAVPWNGLMAEIELALCDSGDVPLP